jgi:hypothetical protein
MIFIFFISPKISAGTVSPGIEPGYIISPVTKIMYGFYWRTAIKEKKRNF